MDPTAPPEPSLAPAAMVLAAGFGSRLQPLTNELPKPLVPVGDRSVLAHIAGQLHAVGYQRLVMNSHHLAACFSKPVLDALPLAATLVRETELLGTAGGVAGAQEALGRGPALIYNGDMLVQIAVTALCRRHEQENALATLAVGSRQEAGQGTVGLDVSGHVVRLREGQFGEERYSADFTGVQVLSAEARDRLPAKGCLVGDLYLPALAEGDRLMAAEVVESWTDIGTPSRYLEANLAWLRNCHEAFYLGDGAVVNAGVQLDEVLIGANARVVGHGLLHRCVIWPGAEAVAPLENAVVTTAGQVLQL